MPKGCAGGDKMTHVDRAIDVLIGATNRDHLPAILQLLGDLAGPYGDEVHRNLLRFNATRHKDEEACRPITMSTLDEAIRLPRPPLEAHPAGEGAIFTGHTDSAPLAGRGIIETRSRGNALGDGLMRSVLGDMNPG